MANIQKRKRYNGGYSYTVRIRVKDIPCLTLTFDSYEEAIEWVTNNESKFRESPKEYFNWLESRRSNINKYPLNPFEKNK